MQKVWKADYQYRNSHICRNRYNDNIVVLIKIETKIEYNKIKSDRNYFELCLIV